jgi:hypothetical protein
MPENSSRNEPKKRLGLFGWLRRIILLIMLVAAAGTLYWYYQSNRETEALKQIISRLTSEERVAEVWVENIRPADGSAFTQLRLKFLEYDSTKKPLPPKYCTFSVNDVIHFEAFVVRLNDTLIINGEGKSVSLFRRAFALDDKGNTYEACELNRVQDVPGGYALSNPDQVASETESRFWKSFWQFALDEKRRGEAGIKNAQIEAPATKFVPEKIYRLILEHDGGLYIEAKDVPEILKGEHLKP